LGFGLGLRLPLTGDRESSTDQRSDLVSKPVEQDLEFRILPQRVEISFLGDRVDQFGPQFEGLHQVEDLRLARQ
jgi:hypothetical protein